MKHSISFFLSIILILSSPAFGTTLQNNLDYFSSQGGGVFTLENKTYSGPITIPSNVSLKGSGQSIISCAGQSGNTQACVLTQGTALTLLGTTTSTLSKGDRAVPISATPTLSANDLVIIYDPSDSSYSAFRTYYRAGEFATVNSVSGNNINLVGGIKSDESYVSGINIYHSSAPYSGSIKNIEIIGDSGAFASLEITDGRNVRLEDLKVSDSGYAAILMKRCYDCTVDHVEALKYLPDTMGTSYGIVLANSQNISITGSTMIGDRHGFTCGGDSDIGSVPSRFITISNSRMENLNGLPGIGGFDLHGNCEYVSVTNSFMDSISMAGNHNSILNSIVIGDHPINVYFSEMSGFDFRFEGNDFTTNFDSVRGRGLFFDIGGNNIPMDGRTKQGGRLIIRGNKFKSNVSSTNPGIKIYNRGAIQTFLIEISDNEFIQDTNSLANSVLIRNIGVTPPGTPFAVVRYVNNNDSGWAPSIEGTTKTINTGNY